MSRADDAPLTRLTAAESVLAVRYLRLVAGWRHTPIEVDARALGVPARRIEHVRIFCDELVAAIGGYR